MWIERYLIVVGTLSYPRLDYTVGSYTPSMVEMGIFVGSIGMFAFLYFTFVQTTPIVSIWEVREGHHLEVKAQRQALAAAREEP
jgi:molybdopterin-containing oxidoreductase family membrane subunit